jgi:hypothetical protein
MIVEFNLSNIIWVVIAGIGGLWALVKVIAIQFKGEIKRDLQEHFRVQGVTNTAQYNMLNSRLETLDAAAKADTGQWVAPFHAQGRYARALRAAKTTYAARARWKLRRGMKLENALLRAAAAKSNL